MNFSLILFKLSYLNSNFVLTLGYLDPALSNPALFKYQTKRLNPSTLRPEMERLFVTVTFESVKKKFPNCFHSNENFLEELFHSSILFYGFDDEKFEFYRELNY